MAAEVAAMKRLCLEPRCPDEARYRGRCQRHARQRGRETASNRHIYDKRKWHRTRRRVLFEQPLCECGAIAVDVHHKVDLADGGDPWARDNLQAMCHACHASLTRQGAIHGST